MLAIQSHATVESDSAAARELAAVAELKYNHVRGLNMQTREWLKVLIMNHGLRVEIRSEDAASARAKVAELQESEASVVKPSAAQVAKAKAPVEDAPPAAA